MITRFEAAEELSRFRSFAGAKTSNGRVEKLADDIFRFVPRDPSGLKVGYLAIVHGNEIIGLPILNSMLNDLLTGKIASRHEVYFGLGNLPAFHAEKRFLERDLNRCFGQTATDTPEARRARELETHLLDRVDYLIDLHQTVHRSLHPFFIFQYASENCFRHLASMNENLTTILQFDAIGEGQNLSTDEYLRGRGRFGVALELGRKGWSTELYELGLGVCVRFLATLQKFSSFAEAAIGSAPKTNLRFFEITDRFVATENDSALDAIWGNFSKFDRGDVLGRIGDRALVSDRAGFMLFPKPGQSVDRGTPMFHIVQPLSVDRLETLAGVYSNPVITDSLV